MYWFLHWDLPKVTLSQALCNVSCHFWGFHILVCRGTTSLWWSRSYSSKHLTCWFACLLTFVSFFVSPVFYLLIILPVSSTSVLPNFGLSRSASTCSDSHLQANQPVLLSVAMVIQVTPQTSTVFWPRTQLRCYIVDCLQHKFSMPGHRAPEVDCFPNQTHPTAICFFSSISPSSEGFLCLPPCFLPSRPLPLPLSFCPQET